MSFVCSAVVGLFIPAHAVSLRLPTSEHASERPAALPAVPAPESATAATPVAAAAVASCLSAASGRAAPALLLPAPAALQACFCFGPRGVAPAALASRLVPVAILSLAGAGRAPCSVPRSPSAVPVVRPRTGPCSVLRPVPGAASLRCAARHGKSVSAQQHRSLTFVQMTLEDLAASAWLDVSRDAHTVGEHLLE